MADIDSKYERLQEILKELGSVVVAFSGGVDSTFLLKVAHDTLGDKAVAVTATSPTYPQNEFLEAKQLALNIGVGHIILESNELEIPGFSDNTPRRCYFCKSELFGILKEKALELKLNHVVDGANCDDLGDYRPGRDAAKELGVRSPLVEAGMDKSDIRLLSKKLDLSTWDKPAFACLSSRFPYGTEITNDRVKRVEACEELLREMHFKQFRVRYHDDVARIEVEEGDFERFLSEGIRSSIAKNFKAQGFKYVSLDIEGYRTGSMNEALPNQEA